MKNVLFLILLILGTIILISTSRLRISNYKEFEPDFDNEELLEEASGNELEESLDKCKVRTDSCTTCATKCW